MDNKKDSMPILRQLNLAFARHKFAGMSRCPHNLWLWGCPTVKIEIRR